MGAPEMYPSLYAEYMTGDPAHDKAFAALADCPSFAQVEAALKVYAHELAERIRAEMANHADHTYAAGLYAGALLIDPEVSK